MFISNWVNTKKNSKFATLLLKKTVTNYCFTRQVEIKR
jgi:hypothetical protein